jgi:hypothetical protein
VFLKPDDENAASDLALNAFAHVPLGAGLRMGERHDEHPAATRSSKRQREPPVGFTHHVLPMGREM